MKRLNKEYKLDVCNHISMKYGTVNKDNPQVIYISGKCWVTPIKEMDYRSRIDYIENEMKKSIKRIFIDDTNFINRFILDFDISTEGMIPNKKKFLSFDFYLRQNENNKKMLKELKELIERKTSTVSNNLVYIFRDNNFQIEKKK